MVSLPAEQELSALGQLHMTFRHAGQSVLADMAKVAVMRAKALTNRVPSKKRGPSA